ncbi:iron complex transport system ATP-binding protein [Rhizobium subbaraonis]|uniref:Iron complex transport system ATP-binding protein n=1 Tax=Rhizobium subbaraonis TaxID=908946 RepID=A0A285UTK8_9HYPH|nr:ABC transporter ATP-binding protein [Rhizobium subbaraonis]SOC45162.1 iron complex transport system ATP-binding protein [Rhizobium subbaraonis]
MTARLVLRDVDVQHGRAKVLSGVSASIKAGQIVGLIGPNGAGKSTLLNAIAGQLSTKGKILWSGKPVDARDIGFMPQQCQVRADLSVLEVILLGRHEQLGWRIADDIMSAASRILAFFAIGDLAARSMQTLSGGQQQLVLLAQRLLREPQLLLLDEATSALDVRHQMHVLRLLKDYVARTGALVLIAVHDLNLAARHSDTVMLLNGGRLVGHGAFDTVITPDVLRSVYGIDAEFIPSQSGISVILPLSPTSIEANPMEETP